MQILIKFIIHNNQSGESILFWSCVLETYIKEKEISFEYLNNQKRINFENENIGLEINYSKWDEKILDEYKDYNSNRPSYFLNKDLTSNTGSPFVDASCKVKTYYKNPDHFFVAI